MDSTKPYLFERLRSPKLLPLNHYIVLTHLLLLTKLANNYYAFNINEHFIILSLVPKHPVRDKFNEVHFLADVDKLLRELRENKTEDEKLCEIEASAIWHAKNVLETSTNRGVKTVQGNICQKLRYKSTDREKHVDVLNPDQF